MKKLNAPRSTLREPSHKLEKYVRESRILFTTLTQDEFAKALGYSTAQFVSNWERGISEIPVKKFRDVARILGINLEVMATIRCKDFRKNILNELFAVDVASLKSQKAAKPQPRPAHRPESPKRARRLAPGRK